MELRLAYETTKHGNSDEFEINKNSFVFNKNLNVETEFSQIAHI